MKSERLFRILGLVDDDLIEEAAAAPKHRAPRRRRWAAAACLAAVCGLGALAMGHLGGMSAPGESGSGIVHEREPLSADGSNVFMSYAGPVFPLSTVENTALTAERTTTWDFAPGAYEDGTPRQWGAAVTENYMLCNPTGGDIVSTALYPFAGSFSELAAELPTVAVGGAEAAPVLYAGPYSGGFRDAGEDDGSTWNLAQLDSWDGYKALLESGAYQKQALADYPALDIPVTVYEFTDAQAPTEEYDAATQAISFTMDENRTTVLSYGFNGMDWGGGGARQYSYFVPNGHQREREVKLLAVLGDDIPGYALQGYKNGDTSPGNELDNVSCTVTRRETTLDALLEYLCGAFLDEITAYADIARAESMALLSPEMFRGAAAELLTQYGILSDAPTDRYGGGRLDDILSEVLHQDRVLYLAFPVTVPAGGTVEVTAKLWKAPSFDYGCSGSENVGLQGYDLVTTLGSKLDFTARTAALVNTETVEIVHQNCGFDLARGVTEAALDPAVEHYYLEIREK